MSMPSDSPYHYEPESQPEEIRPVATMKHSGFGITSLIVSLGSNVFCFLMFVLAGVAVSEEPGAVPEEDPMLILAGLGIIASGLALIFAFIFAVAGFFQADRKKLYSVLGLIFSLMGMMFFGGLMVVGLVMDG